MHLLRNRGKRERDSNVVNARLQIDLAILKMTKILDRVEDQVGEAKKELYEMRTDD